MEAYTYGDYDYFKNMNDTLNDHHNHFKLNQILVFNISSPFTLMDDLF